MLKFKLISITIIIFAFCAISVFELSRKAEVAVLNVVNPLTFEVDINGNKKVDFGETVCIENVKNFSKDDNLFNLTDDNVIKLNYLANEFAQDVLKDKNVKLKLTGGQSQNCKYADIIIGQNSYRNLLLNSGLAYSDIKISNNFEKQFKKAQKLDLTLLNHKSNKYHTLDCKFGNIAHDTVLIPKNHLPKNAVPCKYCHVNSKPNIFPSIISDGSIKMFLTDFTVKLKPDNTCNSEICKEILTQINDAKFSIDIALYGWDDNQEIYNALVKAKSRGVKLRVVYETGSYYPTIYKIINIADIARTDNNQYLMHNKFIIVDKVNVMTGSMNFTNTGLSGFNSNCIFLIKSKQIAEIFTKEFEQMLNGRFHQEKISNNSHSVDVNKTKITPYFSPADKVITTQIIPLIENAQNYIYIPAFVLTHDKLTKALIRAKQRNVDVKIIIDATNTSAARSKVTTLRNAKIPVKVENFAGKLHSKSIIIDDKYIISGSMNLSNSGENKNDENCLIIEDTRLAKHYREFFEYLWAKIPNRYLNEYISAESKASLGSCSDGIDNDFDGKVDNKDEGCF